jgi:acyl carrier protein
MNGTRSLDDRIRSVLQKTVNLSTPVAELTKEANLYHAGLSSFDLVNLLVALEAGFNVDFPNSLMQRETFSPHFSQESGASGL